MPAKTKLPKPLEKEIQKNAVKLLRSLGWEIHRRNVSAFGGTHKGKKWFVRSGEPGQADLFGKLPDGRHAEIEIKRPDERPTLDQARWLWANNRSDHEVSFWVDNLDTLERVARHLMGGGKILYLDNNGRQYPDGWGPSADYDLD